MKKPIEIKDIRKGDVIRFEYADHSHDLAQEWIAGHDRDGFTLYRGTHFLLEHPFKPYWGMVIGDPESTVYRAVYIPGDRGDLGGWLSSGPGWEGNCWAEEKLAQGWEVLEAPEGVKTKED